MRRRSWGLLGLLRPAVLGLASLVVVGAAASPEPLGSVSGDDDG